MLLKKNLIDYFFEGVKPKNQLKIGVEHEKFILDKDTLKPLKYYEKNGILDIFNELINSGWKPIFEGDENTIIGLNRGAENITLEPGGQIELSGAPLDNIHQNCTETSNHLKELKALSNKFNFILLGIGVEPTLSLSEFPWMPKERYSIMKEYMPKVGRLGHHMMQRSCTSQVNFDYISEEDMIKKFRLILNFESVGTAIFANSPFDQGKPSKYKSLRSHFWHNTDNDRAGIIPFVFSNNFNFETYVNYALEVPMYFVKRKKKYIDMTGISFKNFLNGNHEKNNLTGEATINDWIDHTSTLFPQVRLKQYLEVRSMDACSWNEICSPAAFWAGLLYDKISFEAALDLMNDWTYEERRQLNISVPIYGLKTKFRNETLKEVASKLLVFSEEGLTRRNILSSKKDYNETYYLQNIKENINKGISPADTLLEKYENEWKHSTEHIYKEIIF